MFFVKASWGWGVYYRRPCPHGCGEPAGAGQDPDGMGVIRALCVRPLAVC